LPVTSRRPGSTKAGVAERATLDRASDELAEAILEPLSERQRERLVAAMSEVERLRMASQVRIEVTDPPDISIPHLEPLDASAAVGPGSVIEDADVTSLDAGPISVARVSPRSGSTAAGWRHRDPRGGALRG
jgi:hypothetical protein